MACGSFARNKVFVILGYGCGVRGLKVQDFSAGGLRPPWPRREPSALDLRGSMSVSGGLTGCADSRRATRAIRPRQGPGCRTWEVKPAGHDNGVDVGVAPSPLPLEPEV